MRASSGHSPLNSGHGVPNLSRKALEHGDGGLSPAIDLRDEYARGALRIIVKFDGVSRGHPGQIGPFWESPCDDELTAAHGAFALTIAGKVSERGKASGSQRGLNDSV